MKEKPMANDPKNDTSLALPRPDEVTLVQVREVLLPRAAELRQEIAQRGDIDLARDCCRQLNAIRRYLQDREGRDLLAAEQRRMEVLIGKLLGPGVVGVNQHGEASPAGEASQVPKDDRHKFRLMAANEEFVEELLARGQVARNWILERIKRRGEAPIDLIAGDFRETLDGLPDATVSLVLTDPPYAEAALGLYSDLGGLAARALMPGGSLLCYAPHAHLYEVLGRLKAHLRFWWVCALMHQHGETRLPGKGVLVGWKPVVWFVKGHRADHGYLRDVLQGSRPEKAHHEWAQGVDEVKYLIERLTEPGELVLDPFAGSGAFGRAAQALGRQFIGVDLDPSSDKGVAS